MSESVSSLHDAAMEYAQQAQECFRAGYKKRAGICYLIAAAFEEKAARQIAIAAENEPTRGILYLSAASLAMSADSREQAIRCLNDGLAGSPQGRVKDDLVELLTQLVPGDD